MQIQELSRIESIPVKFLEQILLIMKRAGLLRSKRGIGGGYQLDRSPEEITLGEIVTLIDGAFAPLSITPADSEKAPPGLRAEEQGPPPVLSPSCKIWSTNTSTSTPSKTS